ncbi:LOB domain-containing protein 36 [Spinacia oleracea]|uniref:LOB domain-containing protein 36 n=1 Tax=Spinacia oleracea TaxID=3562 RepID=A0ABM3RJ97_SPIOL|nr:LOB domain-containing protein 36 [Spinacia oleracea]
MLAKIWFLLESYLKSYLESLNVHALTLSTKPFDLRFFPIMFRRTKISSNSPCAACKFLRRKCTQECVFAPYFPPDQPQRFANVHKVFGASNVAKLLHDLNVSQREDAVNSLAYEAEARLRDPVYGCVGLISILQQRLKQVQSDLYVAKKELSTYIGPTALMPMIQTGYANSSSVNLMQQHYNMGPMMGINIPSGVAAGPSHGGGGGGGGGGSSGGGQLVIRDAQQQQHLIEAQQLAALAVRDEQEMMRNWEQQQQQQQQQFMRFNGSGGGYDGAVVVGGGGGFNQVGSSSAVTSPSLALGAATFDPNAYNQIQQQQQQQQPQQDESLGQLLLLQQPATPQQQQVHGEHNPQHQPLLLHQQHHHLEHNPQQQPQRAGSEEEDRTIGPAC